MKNLILLITLLAAITSCSEKKTAETTPENSPAADSTTAAAADERDWKAMDDFHMVMAETFHPYKDDNNLKPAKEKAKQLEEEASKWASTPLPAKVNNDDMKVRMNSLKEETAKLSAM